MSTPKDKVNFDKQQKTIRTIKRVYGEILSTENEFLKGINYLLENLPKIEKTNPDDTLKFAIAVITRLKTAIIGFIKELEALNKLSLSERPEALHKALSSLSNNSRILFSTYSKIYPYLNTRLNVFLKKKTDENIKVFMNIIKPIQRTPRYQILSEELLKQCKKIGQGNEQLTAANDIAIGIARYTNDNLTNYFDYIVSVHKNVDRGLSQAMQRGSLPKEELELLSCHLPHVKQDKKVDSKDRPEWVSNPKRAQFDEEFHRRNVIMRSVKLITNHLVMGIPTIKDKKSGDSKQAKIGSLSLTDDALNDVRKRITIYITRKLLKIDDSTAYKDILPKFEREMDNLKGETAELSKPLRQMILDIERHAFFKKPNRYRIKRMKNGTKIIEQLKAINLSASEQRYALQMDAVIREKAMLSGIGYDASSESNRNSTSTVHSSAGGDAKVTSSKTTKGQNDSSSGDSIVTLGTGRLATMHPRDVRRSEIFGVLLDTICSALCKDMPNNPEIRSKVEKFIFLRLIGKNSSKTFNDVISDERLSDSITTMHKLFSELGSKKSLELDKNEVETIGKALAKAERRRLIMVTTDDRYSLGAKLGERVIQENFRTFCQDHRKMQQIINHLAFKLINSGREKYSAVVSRSDGKSVSADGLKTKDFKHDQERAFMNAVMKVSKTENIEIDKAIDVVCKHSDNVMKVARNIFKQIWQDDKQQTNVTASSPATVLATSKFHAASLAYIVQKLNPKTKGSKFDNVLARHAENNGITSREELWTKLQTTDNPLSDQKIKDALKIFLRVERAQLVIVPNRYRVKLDTEAKQIHSTLRERNAEKYLSNRLGNENVQAYIRVQQALQRDTKGVSDEQFKMRAVKALDRDLLACNTIAEEKANINKMLGIAKVAKIVSEQMLKDMPLEKESLSAIRMNITDTIIKKLYGSSKTNTKVYKDIRALVTSANGVNDAKMDDLMNSLVVSEREEILNPGFRVVNRYSLSSTNFKLLQRATSDYLVYKAALLSSKLQHSLIVYGDSNEVSKTIQTQIEILQSQHSRLFKKRNNDIQALTTNLLKNRIAVDVEKLGGLHVLQHAKEVVKDVKNMAADYTVTGQDLYFESEKSKQVHVKGIDVKEFAVDPKKIFAVLYELKHCVKDGHIENETLKKVSQLTSLERQFLLDECHSDTNLKTVSKQLQSLPAQIVDNKKEAVRVRL